jgi:hypothetical protein
MRTTTGFHADHARRPFREKLRHSISSQHLLEDEAVLGINAVDRKNVLGQIEANTYDFHGMSPSSDLISAGSPRERGGVHAIGSCIASVFCVAIIRQYSRVAASREGTVLFNVALARDRRAAA